MQKAIENITNQILETETNIKIKEDFIQSLRDQIADRQEEAVRIGMPVEDIDRSFGIGKIMNHIHDVEGEIVCLKNHIQFLRDLMSERQEAAALNFGIEEITNQIRETEEKIDGYKNYLQTLCDMLSKKQAAVVAGE